MPDRPIHFAVTGGRLTRVTVTGADGSTVPGTLDGATDTWTPSPTLKLDSSYTISATATNTAGEPVTKQLSVRTLSPTATVTAESVTPQADATVGDAQPVVVDFTKPITDRAAVQRALSVTDTDHVTGAWHWLTDRRVDYRPRNYWPLGDKITAIADLDGVDTGKGVWATGDYTSTFTVNSDLHAVVYPSSHTMNVYNGTTLERTLPASTGMPGFATWGGDMVVLDKQPSIQMTSCSVALGCSPSSPSYYSLTVNWDVHLTWSGTYVHDASWDSSIGSRNDSHGCVHLSAADARWFYNQVEPGDLVQVVNPAKPVEINNGDGDWNLSWAQWSTPNATA